MTTRALGPTVNELPSRKTRCARSLAAVVTSSLACTSMPMRRMRSFSFGGFPKGVPSEAVVTPTGERASVVADNARTRPLSAAQRSRLVVVSLMVTPGRLSEPPVDAEHEAVVRELVVGNAGAAHETAGGKAEGRAHVERHGEHDAEDGVVLETQDTRIDDDIGLVVGPPLLGRRKVDRPGQPGAQQRIGEADREAAADAVQAVALPGRDIGSETLHAADG